MSGDRQPFGYSGQSATCLWCGRRLRRTTVLDTGRMEREGLSYAVRPAAGLGAYADDCFCGLRCGYQFGLRQAQLGGRLERREGS
jgi:hypothetical protein